MAFLGRSISFERTLPKTDWASLATSSDITFALCAFLVADESVSIGVHPWLKENVSGRVSPVLSFHDAAWRVIALLRLRQGGCLEVVESGTAAASVRHKPYHFL